MALAVQSGSDTVKIPQKSSFSKGFHDLIYWMLNLDLKKRPFIEDVIARVSVLVETSEECFCEETAQSFSAADKCYRHFSFF